MNLLPYIKSRRLKDEERRCIAPCPLKGQKRIFGIRDRDVRF
jgi:hypothetical protein